MSGQPSGCSFMPRRAAPLFEPAEYKERVPQPTPPLAPCRPPSKPSALIHRCQLRAAVPLRTPLSPDEAVRLGTAPLARRNPRANAVLTNAQIPVTTYGIGPR